MEEGKIRGPIVQSYPVAPLRFSSAPRTRWIATSVAVILLMGFIGLVYLAALPGLDGLVVVAVLWGLGAGLSVYNALHRWRLLVIFHGHAVAIRGVLRWRREPLPDPHIFFETTAPFDDLSKVQVPAEPPEEWDLSAGPRNEDEEVIPLVELHVFSTEDRRRIYQLFLPRSTVAWYSWTDEVDDPEL